MVVRKIENTRKVRFVLCSRSSRRFPRKEGFSYCTASNVPITPASTQPNDDVQRPPRQLWLLLAGVVMTVVFVLFRSRRGFLVAAQANQALTDQAQTVVATPVFFKLNLPGVHLSLGERTPGWVYFLLLMAAGCGLFISEEALNVWVGASLARSLTFGTQTAFLSSLSANASYILSTIFWVYWGVCISDLVPFYTGRLASKSTEAISKKLRVSKEEYERVTATVQRYGNLIGFVERFSLGVRNPTSFLAGAVGISPTKFFAGVCAGGLITLPLQMSVGFILRGRPLAALTGVAAVVGAWTVFPYIAAGLASLIFIVNRDSRDSK